MDDKPLHLLLIEDDEALRTVVARSLGRRGFTVAVCEDGTQALPRWRAHPPDVVLLDLSLPGQDGLQVLAQARRLGLRQPVLILTARGTVGDRVLGLNTGADDYLPKPFDLDELEARVRALGRRRRPPDGPQISDTNLAIGTRRMGDVSYEIESGAIWCAGEVLELAPRELALMQALMARPGQAVARDTLLNRVFADEAHVLPEAIEVVVYRLRKRLASTGLELVTLRGLGYLLKVAAPP